MPKDQKILNQLLLAKKMSDKEDYVSKYNIMQKLLKERPEEFYIDQDNPDYPGIVHAPTGFRMHLPKQATYGIEKKAQAKWRTPENLNKLIKHFGVSAQFKTLPLVTETMAKHSLGVALKNKQADMFLHNKDESAAQKFFDSIRGKTITTSLEDTPATSRFIFRGLKPKPDGDIPIYEGVHTGSAVTFGSPHYSVARDYLHKIYGNKNYPGILGVYEKSPLQSYLPDFGIERSLKQKSIPKVNFTDVEEKINDFPTTNAASGNRPQITITKNPRLSERFTYETPITSEHNPLKFLLLQNNVNRGEVKLIDLKDDKTIRKLVNFFREQDKYLHKTPRAAEDYASVDWLIKNPRLKDLKDKHPDKFSELMRRRVNKLFFKENPNQKSHVGGVEKIINELQQ